jgi:hypothetical protein
MNREPFRIEPYIEAAKRVPGGHLHIGRGGYTLHQGGSQLSGYDCEAVKAVCIAAGLPVIDSRSVPFEAVAKLAVSGPMVAVDREPDPAPWHAYSYAPLRIVAAAYGRAGAEIFNIPAADLDDRAFKALPEGPLKNLIAGWEDHVLNTEL